MRDQSTWSLNLGRWGGIHVQLHMFFLLFAVFTLYLSWLYGREADGNDLMWAGALSLIVLLGSVLLHELGHVAAALRANVVPGPIVIGPLGGMAPLRLPSHPVAALLVTLAGPATNLLLGLISATALILVGQQSLLELIHPLRPGDLTSGSTVLVGLKLTFWINWLLLLVNLVPAFPLDGGRALQAALMIARPYWSRWNAGLVVVKLAKLTAAGLIVVPLLVRNPAHEALVPSWFALALLGVFLLFGAKQEEHRLRQELLDDESYSPDPAARDKHFDPAHAGKLLDPLLSHWFDDGSDEHQLSRQELEAEEESRVDEILARLHETGMEGLSPDDRALLQRVSERYRSRLRH